MNKVLVDKARLLRRVIIISWISLALCFVIKIFGGNFFEIMCENPNYKALCEYADTHLWLKFTIGFVSALYCQSLYNLSIIQEYKYKLWQFFCTLFCVLLNSIVRLFYNGTWTLLLDFLLFAGLPMILLGKKYKRYYQILIAWVITFLLQVVSLLVKNIGLVNVGETYFVGLIYSMDIYIMCFLYYLYRNFEKERKSMGILWGMFMGKPVDKLKEMKVKREKQIEKLNEEIKAIETEIAKQSDKK